MFKQNSIFQKVLKKNLYITSIPLIIVLMVICCLVCVIYKNEVISSSQKNIDEYAKQVQLSLSTSIEKTNYVLKYNYLIDNLSRNFDTTTNVLEYINNVTIYLDSINSNISSSSILIYFTNATLFENKYMLHFEKLEDRGNILKYFEDNKMSFYMSDNIFTDENGNKYFSFYRKMPLNPECILSCRSYIPESTSSSEIELLPSTNKIGGGHVTAHINEHYVAVMSLNNKAIYGAYTFFILLFFILGVVFVTAIISLSYKATAHATESIEKFIASLNENDISAINISTSADDADELAIIKRTINTLVLTVNETTQAHLKSEIEKQELTLELLQRKLDPHILYNSLSVIKLKAFRFGNDEIINIINHLVTYYRALLSRGDEYVTISEEISMLQKYITVCEISSSKEYIFKYDLPEDVANLRIPHLILQPFVENCVVHGFTNDAKKHEVFIKCRKNNGYVIINIRDNGIGIPQDIMNQLNNIETYDNNFGIKSTYERLKLLCGKDSSVLYTSVIDEFTEVEVKFHYIS